MRLQKRSGCGGSQVVCHPFFSGCSGRGPQLRSCGGGAWRSHGGRSAKVRAGSGARALVRSCGPARFRPVGSGHAARAVRVRPPPLSSEHCGRRDAASVRRGLRRALRCVPPFLLHPGSPAAPRSSCGARLFLLRPALPAASRPSCCIPALLLRPGLPVASRPSCCVPPFLLHPGSPAAPRSSCGIPPFLLHPGSPAASRLSCCAPALLLRSALPTAPRRFSRRPSRRPLRRPSRCGAAACRA